MWLSLISKCLINLDCLLGSCFFNTVKLSVYFNQHIELFPQHQLPYMLLYSPILSLSNHQAITLLAFFQLLLFENYTKALIHSNQVLDKPMGPDYWQLAFVKKP